MATRRTNNTGNSDTLQEAISVVLSSNTELRDLAESVVRDSLKHVKHVMKWGTPGEKASITKMILGLSLKSLAKANEAQVDAQQQAAYQALRSSLAASLLGQKPAALPDTTTAEPVKMTA